MYTLNAGANAGRCCTPATYAAESHGSLSARGGCSIRVQSSDESRHFLFPTTPPCHLCMSSRSPSVLAPRPPGRQLPPGAPNPEGHSACARNVASHARTSPARLLRLVRLRLLFLMPDQISSDAPPDLSPCVSQTECTQPHPRPITLYQPCRHPSPRSPSPAHCQVRHSYCMHIYCFVRLPASRWRRASIFSRGGFSSFARGVRGRHAYVF